MDGLCGMVLTVVESPTETKARCGTTRSSAYGGLDAAYDVVDIDVEVVMERGDFVALENLEDVPWVEASTVASHLPAGARLKVLSEDPETGRTDLLVEFPPGYVEPQHAHEDFGHSVIILKGTMNVNGKTLGPGSYVFGGKDWHGPMEYPEGCTLFSSRKRF